MESITGISAYTSIGFDLDASPSGGESQGRAFSRSVRDARTPSSKQDTDATGLRLNPEQEEAVRELEQRDQEVRAHEQAHIAASGGLASGASFSLQRGPNGQMYAVGGNVSIDTSEESDPDANIAKAQKIRAAANAPAEPSSQDKAVAAQASQMEASARQEKLEAQTGRSSTGGLTSFSGPATLSGTHTMEGRTDSVSNRSKDAFGSPGIFGFFGTRSPADPTSAADKVGAIPNAHSGGDASTLHQPAEQTAAYAGDAQTRAIQRASRAYQKAGYPPAALAPYGTGISLTA